MAGGLPPGTPPVLKVAEESRSEAIRQALARLAGRGVLKHSQACVHCGLCGESCHIYLDDPSPENLPAAKAGKVAALVRRYHTWTGRTLPWLNGARDLDEAALDELTEAVHGRCTACGRCGLHCAIGLDVQAVIAAGREVLTAAGRIPEGVMKTRDNQLRTGNQMAIPREEFLETVAWLSDELARDLGDEKAVIPVDQPGQRVLYLVNPREVRFFPLSLQAAAGVFHRAMESWTLSSRVFDVTNYALFAGDPAGAAELTRRAEEEARRLGVQEIVLSECGHGFRAFRWEGANWLGRPMAFPLRSILDLLSEYLDQGRLTLDPSRNPRPVTLHDPCNLVRWGGVSEPQRRILRRAVERFVEMTPNREHNYCCGGGGGMLSNEEYGARRVASGSVKAGQIRATGAGVVACPCHNCADQLLEITRVNDLDVEILSVVEIVYEALRRE